MRARYTLYRYTRHHFAIDCEDCEGKVCNIKPHTTGAEIMARLNAHDKEHVDDARRPAHRL